MCDSSSYSSSSSSVRLRLSLVSSAILTDQRGMETRRWDVCKQTGRWSTVLTREVRPPTYRHVGSRHDVMSVAIDWLERKGLLSRLAARTICIRQCSMPSNVMICPGSFSWIFSGNSSSGPTSTIINNQHGCLVVADYPVPYWVTFIPRDKWLCVKIATEPNSLRIFFAWWKPWLK